MARNKRVQTVLVTGGSGFLGQHVRQARWPRRWDLVTPPSRTLDIVDRGRVLQEIGAWQPQVIVHLAYRKDRRTIAFGSANVAEAAAACGARLIHLSSDVVFAGRELPYTEADRPDPSYDYGRWKTDAEEAVTAACPSAVLLRTSLLYGREIVGPLEQALIAALDGTRPMSFFTDEVRCPTYAGDVAAAIVSLTEQSADDRLTGPLHVVSPQPMSRYELAMALAPRLGLDRRDVRAAQDSGAGGGQRPTRLVLDPSKAAIHGIRCRPLDDVLS